MREALTMGAVLDRAAATWPDREFLVFGTERATYREVKESADRMARGLRGLGVERGDHIGILMDDGIDYVEVVFGAAMIGAVVVTLNARYKQVELAHTIEHSDIQILITDSTDTDFATRIAEVAPEVEDADPANLVLDAAPMLRHVISLGGPSRAGFLGRDDLERYAATIEPAEVEKIAAAIDPGDIGMLMYTSGTTGAPKGCLLRNEALVRNGANLAARFEMTGIDRMWVVGTLFHMMGIQPMLACASTGAAFVGMKFYSSQEGIRLLMEEHCTIAFPVRDNDFLPVVDHPDYDADRLQSIRRFYCIGLRENVFHVQEKLPWAPQVAAWGCTEATGMMSLGSFDDPLEVRLTTGGYPFPGNTLSVIGEDGNPLPAGEVGEIRYTGYCVFAGYYKDPERTAAVIGPNGELNPGDLAFLDEAGRPTFAGTKKGMVRVGGENVSYLEVEDFLCEHPAVKMVVVVGVRDARYNEVPAAFIELTEGGQATEQELIDYGLGRIATFKIPRYIRFVEEWPMSTSKIQRPPLKERLERELDEAGIAEAPKIDSRRTESTS
jgi:fatty-acyl-CoA synthase